VPCLISACFSDEPTLQNRRLCNLAKIVVTEKIVNSENGCLPKRTALPSKIPRKFAYASIVFWHFKRCYQKNSDFLQLSPSAQSFGSENLNFRVENAKQPGANDVEDR
jgi:hypothetical protein